MQATESVNKSSSAREERLAGPTNSISHLNAGMHRTTLSMDNVSSSASQVDTPQSTRSGNSLNVDGVEKKWTPLTFGRLQYGIAHT